MTRLLPILLLLAACAAVPPPVSSTATSSRGTSSSSEYMAPEHRCVARGPLPDVACTPGVVATRDLAIICGQSTRERRHVTEATRRAVLEAYGIAWEDRGRVEVDHLVPLELGGSNDEANLWPEPREGADGAEAKDRVENALHRRVCAGEMRIEDAQRIMGTDWRMGR